MPGCLWWGGKMVAAIDRLVFGDNNQGGWCQACSGSTWKGIDCFELPAIGILVLVDKGRPTEQGTLSLRVSDVGGGCEEGEGGYWRRRRGEEWKETKKERETKDGNKPSSAVIFRWDFWQQSSKDKMFHCKTGYILRCTLNFQVFGVVFVT